MRSRLAISLAALACGLALATSLPRAAEAGCGGTRVFHARADVAPGRAPLAIGDSVLLGAAEETAAAGYDVNVRGCRSAEEGLRLLRVAKRRNRLPRLVVIALGSNSDFTRANVRAALRMLGPTRMLGLVTPREIRGYPTTDATTMRAAARRWPSRIVLLDWLAYTRKRPALTYDDRIHLTPAGQRAMARLLRGALSYATDPHVVQEPPPPSSPPPGSGGAGAVAP